MAVFRFLGLKHDNSTPLEQLLASCVGRKDLDPAPHQPFHPQGNDGEGVQVRETMPFP